MINTSKTRTIKIHLSFLSISFLLIYSSGSLSTQRYLNQFIHLVYFYYQIFFKYRFVSDFFIHIAGSILHDFGFCGYCVASLSFAKIRSFDLNLSKNRIGVFEEMFRLCGLSATKPSARVIYDWKSGEPPLKTTKLKTE